MLKVTCFQGRKKDSEDTGTLVPIPFAPPEKLKNSFLFFQGITQTLFGSTSVRKLLLQSNTQATST